MHAKFSAISAVAAVLITAVYGLLTTSVQLAPASLAPQPVHAPVPTFALGPVRDFVENLGQWPERFACAASRNGQWLAVTDRGLELGSSGTTVALHVRGLEHGESRGEAPTGTRCNFLHGDATRHVSNARVFESVVLQVGAGIELTVRPTTGDAAFTYELRFASPRGELPVFDVLGANALSVDAADGSLVIETPTGQLRQSPPIAWHDADGARRLVGCGFVPCGPTSFTFAAAALGDEALCIDPDLQWSATVGGNSLDNGYCVGTASNGDVFVGGTTQSTNLPTTPGVPVPGYQGSIATPLVSGDGFVARLAAADGSLLWCTYLGGAENERLTEAQGIGDDVVVSGWTTSADFPTTPGAYDRTHNGNNYTYIGGDVFVTRLAGDGQSLIWSSFIGGSDIEYPLSMAVGPDESVAVSGHVHSSNYPTTAGAWSASMAGSSDMFVSRLSANGATLLASTYFGGPSGEEYPHAMTFTADGDLLIGGATDSTVLPVTSGCYDPTFNGGTDHKADGFVARFDAATGDRVWCTYLGTPANEYVRGIAVHEDGSMTLTGWIDGPGLPTTTQVFGPNPFGSIDGFAWRLSADGATTLWASYYGGNDVDGFDRCADLGGGRVACFGRTRSVDVPFTPGSSGTGLVGSHEAWLVVLSASGSSIDYSAAFGGLYADVGADVERNVDGRLVCVGTTYGGGFPITAPGAVYRGAGDSFCLSLAGMANGLTRVGDPTGDCGRGARVMARAAPRVGAADFALTAGYVPPTSPALAAVSGSVLAAGMPVLGFDLWLDPAALIATPAVVVDADGLATLPLPLPAAPGLAGADLAVQFVWLDACALLSFGASDAVAIVIQP